jgi:hypothetical protein
VVVEGSVLLRDGSNQPTRRQGLISKGAGV